MKIRYIVTNVLLLFLSVASVLFIIDTINREINKYHAENDSQDIITDHVAEDIEKEPTISAATESDATESSAEEEIEEEPILEISNLELLLKLNPIIKVNKQLACDTDGAPKNNSYAKSDPNWLPGTSYTIHRKYLDATKINYIVYPTGNWSSNTEKGLLGLVIDLNTGKYVFVVCGDCKEIKRSDYTSKKTYLEVYNRLAWRELSIHALWDLGYENASGNNAPKGNFLTMIIPNSRIYSYSENLDINLQVEEKILDILNQNSIDIDLLVDELIVEYK